MIFAKSLIISLISCVFIFPQNEQTVKVETSSNINSLQKINYPGDSSINVNYYKLNLRVTYKPNYLTGIVTIKASPANNSLASFFLDLQNQMIVDSILSGNEKLQYTHSDAKLNITLSKTYNPGENFEISIYYKGVPGATGFGSFEFKTHGNDEPAIWTLSEPYGSSDWFPCKDTPADKADSSDVWITVDNNLYAVSNGNLAGIIQNRDGTATYKWTNRYPISQYLISLAIANYTIYKNYFYYEDNNTPGPDSMPVINYIYPENLESYRANLDKIPEMLRITSDYFGLYPFIKEKYGNAEMGWQGGGGMEHQTVSSMSNFDEIVLLHELVHQWFGDKITCRDWENIWLNEGFATYGEALYIEAVYGKDAYDNYILSRMNDAKNAQGSIYVENINSISQIFNGNRSYAKGGMVLHMLRGVVGDSIFFKIMKAYSSDPQVAYGTAVTSDFQRAAEDVSGKDLYYFFNEWIYGVNYPKYKVIWSSKPKDQDLFEVTADISQSINTNPSFFTMPVQVQISSTEGDTLFSFLNNQQDQQLKFLVKGKPSLFTLDPSNWILKDVLTISDNNDQIVNQIKFKLEQNHPNPVNPFNPTTNIDYQVPEFGTIGNVPVQLTVYDILGNKIVQLVNGNKPPGSYTAVFNGAGLASGIYFYRLKAGPYISTKKLVLLK